MSVVIGRCVTGLLYMMIISVSSGKVYIQSGSNITDCNMKCPEDDVTLELFRECRGQDRTLLENLCYFNASKSHDPRLRLDTGSGCWKLTRVRKDDSCMYKIWCHCDRGRLLSSTEIRVLDPVLISNITNNGSRLGEETAVSVQFSGEESAVTWEVDGEPLPERYRLIDDNRTLIIPGVQRDDAERRFRVRITNPVSEEIREYRLINDTMFIRMLEAEDSVSCRQSYSRFVLVAASVVILCSIIMILIRSRRKMHDKKIEEDVSLNIKNESVPIMEIGAVPTMKNGAVPTMENGAVPTMENGAVPIMKNGVVPIMENGVVPIMKNRVVLIMKNGVVPIMKIGAVPIMENGAVPAMKNGSVPTMQNGSVPIIRNLNEK